MPRNRQPQHAADRARGQLLVVRRLAGQRDHRPFERSQEREGDGPRGRSTRNRAVPAARPDQTSDPLDSGLVDPLDLSADRVDLAAELDAERHHHAGDVAPAEDGVAAGQSEQLRSRSSSCEAGSPTSRIQFSFTQAITASARSALSLNWW